MRASDVPIADLIEKARADEGSLSIDEIEALERYKRLTAKKSDVKPRKAKRRGRPESVEKSIERIRKTELAQLQDKQARGETLTAANYAFIREVLAAEADKKNGAKVGPGDPLEKRLAAAKIEAFDHLLDLMRTGRGTSRLEAAKTLKLWAQEECHEELEPITLKVIDIEKFGKLSDDESQDPAKVEACYMSDAEVKALEAQDPK